jgi:hypothetical protein
VEEENPRVAVQHGVGNRGQKGQQGPADEGDGAGQLAQPGTGGQWSKKLYKWRIPGYGKWKMAHQLLG